MLFTIVVTKDSLVIKVWEQMGMGADGVLAFQDNPMIGNLEVLRLFIYLFIYLFIFFKVVNKYH